MSTTSRSAGYAALLLTLGLVGCVRATPRLTPSTPNVDVTMLWMAPDDLAPRDLFHGPGGKALVPDTSLPFALVAEDRTGYSGGYDVKAADGLTWSVKLGPEAQTEVVVSRILWAIGYHQPPTYFVTRWSLAAGTTTPQEHARFRPDLPSWKVVDEWSWYENDFLNTREFKGLVVTNVLLNNWDWKTSNNKIYEVDAPGGPKRVHVVRDLGASLGRTSYPLPLRLLRLNAIRQGTRNDIEGFESQALIKNVNGDRIEFNYRGIHGPLLETISRNDVVWAATLLSKLSDAQWHDAFRAGGYDDILRSRYITKIKAKIGEALRLADV
jgi:hypothetical protein